ncbi:MAG TPA: VCBS repeat-containing protein [Planctomycetota bacterium]|nr:VCBS repeat-containing protein [Planctomycetota bacterium]
MLVRSLLGVSSALGLLSVCALPAAAQSQLATYQLPGPLGSVGERVGLAGDVDGDGLMDLLAAGDFGAATFAGADGALLGFQPYELVDSFDSVLNVAGLDDADGDGQLDLVVCTSRSGASAYSRATGELLWNVPGSFGGSLGWRMAVLTDLDSDGVDDAAFGEPDADPNGLSSAGSIHVVSVATGALIHRIDGTLPQQGLGRAVAAFDAGGNGQSAELIVGERSHEAHGQTVGRLRILSAVSGATLLEIVNDQPSFNFGTEVADAGDLDGDGLHDLAATASISSVAQTRTWSGAKGGLLWTATGTQTLSLRSVGDANGDDVPDLVVGGPGALIFPGTAKLLDGATGALIGSISGVTEYSFQSIAAPGDVTGDGLPDLLIGNPASDNLGLEASASLKQLPSGALALSLSLPVNGTGLGLGAALAGDFDRDGQEDLALLSVKDLAVFSGDSGELLQQFELGLPTFFFSSPVLACPGDLDGDGTVDFAVGDGFQFNGTEQQVGRVELYSGADGSSLGGAIGAVSVENFGAALAATVDHDGDGVADLYVGVPGRMVNGVAAAGVVELRSGASFAVIDTLHGLIQTTGRFGSSLDTGGDLNGDGVPELAVGSREEQPGQLNSGTLHVLDGATGASLWTIGGTLDSSQTHGAIVGDGDGDEVPDLLVAESQWPQSGANFNRGRVRLVSGATGLMLWDEEGHLGQPSAGLGRRYGAAGDVNGDGYADVMASSTDLANSATVHVFSGLDGATLDLLDLPPDGSFVGALLPFGRFDAGACDDVLIGSTGLGGNGGAFAYASGQGGLHGYTDLGFAKPSSAGELPTLRAYGDLGPGSPVTVRARHLPPSKPGSWFIGLSAGYLPFKQGVLVPDPFGPFFRIFVATDSTGSFSVTAPNPQSVFLGLSIVHQVWIQDPGATAGVCATNGLQESFK